jgi:hypothetical protein
LINSLLVEDKLKKKSNRFLKVREKSGEKIREKNRVKKSGEKNIYPNDVTNFHSTKTNPLLVVDWFYYYGNSALYRTFGQPRMRLENLL